MFKSPSKKRQDAVIEMKIKGTFPFTFINLLSTFELGNATYGNNYKIYYNDLRVKYCSLHSITQGISILFTRHIRCQMKKRYFNMFQIKEEKKKRNEKKGRKKKTGADDKHFNQYDEWSKQFHFDTVYWILYHNAWIKYNIITFSIHRYLVFVIVFGFFLFF